MIIHEKGVKERTIGPYERRKEYGVNEEKRTTVPRIRPTVIQTQYE